MKNLIIVLVAFISGCAHYGLYSDETGSYASGDAVALNRIEQLPYVPGTMVRNHVPVGVARGSRRMLRNGVENMILMNARVDGQPLMLLDPATEIEVPGLHYKEKAGFRLAACTFRNDSRWGCTHVVEGDLVEIVDLPDPGLDIDSRLLETPSLEQENRRCFRKEFRLSPRSTDVTEISVEWFNILEEGCPDLKAPKQVARRD
jgi:hypothetical protein